MNTLTLGIAVDNNRFLISFTYYAHGKNYCDEFTSPVAIPQGETFAVSYNALHPQQNTKSSSFPSNRISLFGLGIAGSVAISIIFVMMMYGCN